MPQLVLIRHGQSQWNLENRFTGCGVAAGVHGQVDVAEGGGLARANICRPQLGPRLADPWVFPCARKLCARG